MAKTARKDGSRERWTAKQCAEHLGIADSTWWKYASASARKPPSERHMPDPCKTRDPATGKVTWWRDEVEAYAKNRPGRGYRTDLYGSDPVVRERARGKSVPVK
jgi:predicted DNA-binding transcriptional regulator AlpA